jgi:hypothetical protein
MSNASTSVRKEILDVLDHFLSGWAISASHSIASVFEPCATLVSSAHGTFNGPTEVAAVLSSDWAHQETTDIASTNHYVGIDGDSAVLGAYLYGRVSVSQTAEPTLIFGALVVGELRATDRGWLFTRLQLTLNWLDGDRNLIPRWTRPRPRRLWENGDEAPHLVNELDSPWTRLPNAKVVGSPQDEIAEVFMRYIWAMDQADFGQMRDTLTEDIGGSFPPIGDLRGRHEVMGQLKDFRQAWPWMQHFCVPLRIDIQSDKAQMLLGRVIAHRPTTEEGLPLYGAHYRIELRREDNRWRIYWFEYIEGWIAGLSDK